MVLSRRLGLASLLVLILALAWRFLLSKPAAPFFAPRSEGELAQLAKGRNVLIVGGTKGIGAGLARALAEKGASVTVAGRKRSAETPSHAKFIPLDASTVRACRKFVREDLARQKFDTVVFTLGIITRSQLTRTSDGIEEDLAISYVSRFVITNELIRANQLEGHKRIYIMGYPGENIKITDENDINIERHEYKQWPVHMNTVVLNEALVHTLAKRNPDLHVFGLNPGLIKTDIRDNLHGGHESLLGRTLETLIGVLMPSVETYVHSALLPLIVAPELDGKTAISFSQQGAQLQINPSLEQEAVRENLWRRTEELLKAKSHE